MALSHYWTSVQSWNPLCSISSDYIWAVNTKVNWTVAQEESLFDSVWEVASHSLTQWGNGLTIWNSWGSVSCSRTFRHVDRKSQRSNCCCHPCDWRTTHSANPSAAHVYWIVLTCTMHFNFILIFPCSCTRDDIFMDAVQWANVLLWIYLAFHSFYLISWHAVN